MNEDRIERSAPPADPTLAGKTAEPWVGTPNESSAAAHGGPTASVPPESEAHAAEDAGTSEPVTLGDWHALSPRHVKFQRIVSGITLLMVFPPLIFVPALIGVFTSIVWLATLIPLGVLLIALGSFWLAWAYPPLHHRHAAYRVDERQIEWRHGVWWRSITVVPRSRVQHTDVSQGPFERRFGLGTLHIHTAGTEHSRVSIAGLEHARANWIRDHLVLGAGSDAV